MIPGEYMLKDQDVEINVGRATVEVNVINQGDRPIQVGSHYHFFEVNRALSFERGIAKGMRLNIPSGNAVRFEPGEQKKVTLVSFAGARHMQGFDNQCNAVIALSAEAL
jgi:urease subunit beta